MSDYDGSVLVKAIKVFDTAGIKVTVDNWDCVDGNLNDAFLSLEDAVELRRRLDEAIRELSLVGSPS